MYGWTHNCLKETILNLCGESKWLEICERAGVSEDHVRSIEKDTYVEDEEYYVLFNAALELLPHLTEQDLYDLYGDYFISYIQHNGYETYLLTFGDTLFDLLNNMNRLHMHLACSMDKMKVPVIHCVSCDEKLESKSNFFLHYSSPRGSRLKGMLAGLVKSVARQYFSSTVAMTELSPTEDGDDEQQQATSTVWKVKQTFDDRSRTSSVSSWAGHSDCSSQRPKLTESFSLSSDQFELLAPYHIIFDSAFEILRVSNDMIPSWTSSHSLPPHTKLLECFRVSAAGIDGISDMDWDSFHTAVIVTSKQKHSFYFETKKIFTKSGKSYSFVGNIIFLKNYVGQDNAAVFLCSPNVDTLEQMYDQGVNIQHLKCRDDCRMQMLLNQANLEHFQTSSSEAIEKLDEEVVASSKAKGALDAKRRLMMYITHEIRTPLSIAHFGFQLIKGQLDKLKCLHQEDSEAFVQGNGTASVVDKSLPLTGNTTPPLHTEGTLTSNADAALQQRQTDIRRAIHELSSITVDSSHSVEVAISILNDFLNYEKLQADVLDMFNDFTPCSLIKNVVDEFYVEACHFKVDLSFDTRLSDVELQDEVFIFADKQKLSQVVRNFVSNALKFTPPGGSVIVSLTLNYLDDGGDPVVETSKEGSQYAKCGYLHVDVQDTGAGIAKENHGKVFHEMAQFNPNELQGGGGSGLGLYISRAIVEKLGGSVGFESDGEGCGCRFFFDLPAYHLECAIEPLPKPLFSTASSSSPLRGRTILICDDAPLVRKMLKKILLGMGVQECLEAEDGLQGVQIMKTALETTDPKLHVDCILLDDHMPKLRGPEVAKRIREMGFTNPIVGVTGSAASEDVDDFLSGGADIVLNKPLDLPKLVNFLRQRGF